MSDAPAGLTVAQQQALIGEILTLAIRLQEGGDPLLTGHYMHLRERAEMLLDLVEPVGWHET